MAFSKEPFLEGNFFFLSKFFPRTTFDARQRGYDVAAALVVLYDRIKIIKNQALSFVNSAVLRNDKVLCSLVSYVKW